MFLLVWNPRVKCLLWYISRTLVQTKQQEISSFISSKFSSSFAFYIAEYCSFRSNYIRGSIWVDRRRSMLLRVFNDLALSFFYSYLCIYLSSWSRTVISGIRGQNRDFSLIFLVLSFIWSISRLYLITVLYSIFGSWILWMLW